MKTRLLLASALFGIFVAPCGYATDSPPWQSQAWTGPIWEGFYLGVNAGGSWGHNDTNESTTGGASTGFNPSFDTTGGLAGVHGGYNYLMNSVVVGLDADFDSSDTDGGYRIIRSLNGEDEKYQWVSTVRARVGVPLGNFLPYVTGGLALSDIKDTFAQNNTVYENHSQTRAGWTVGAGLEYALPENFSVRVDYRYADFGSYTDTSTTALPGLRFRQEPTLNSVTAGISYNFR